MGATMRTHVKLATLVTGICLAGLVAGCAPGPSAPDGAVTDSSAGITVPNLPHGDPPGDGGTPVQGGEVILGMSKDINSFDPIQKLNIPATAIYDQLLRYDENGEAVPYLASSMETSDGGKTWVMGLRPDVRFHDGTPLDADAVIYNMNRHMDSPEGQAHAYAAKIQSVTAADALTVRFELKDADGGFAGLFAENPAVASLGVVGSPAAIEEWGDDYTNHPVGAGPYKFVSWARGDKAVLERNDDYWQEGLPYLDKLTFVPRSDAQTRGTSLKNREVDIIETTDIGDFLPLVSDPDLKYYLDGGGGSYLTLGQDKPPFDDIRMRRAAVMAIDYDQMSEVLFEGQMQRSQSPMGPSSAYYSESAVEAFPDTDQEAAKALVEEYKADGGDPSFTYEGSNTPQGTKNAQFLQSQWEAVGMDVEIELYDLATWVQKVREGKYQIGSKGFHGSANPYPLLASMFGTGAPVNEGHYTNPEMDDLLERARHATTEEERIRMYDEAQTLANEDIVNIWFATGYFGLIAQRYVHGIERSGGGLTYYANLWREEE